MSIQQMYEHFGERVQFLNIYIREAHSIDGWWLGGRFTKWVIQRIFGDRASMRHYEPQTIEERRAIATECDAALLSGVRTYVDEMDDRVNRAYVAWPTRLYLVGLDGRIAHAADLGPYGMLKLKPHWDAIEAYLAGLEGR